MKVKSNRLAVFLHMPKCGGKSLESLLLKNYGLENAIRIYRPGRQPIDSIIPKIPKHKARSATLMYGHIPYGTGEKIGRACDYFTVLRGGASRVLSFYRYVKYDFVEHPLHKKFNKGNVSLLDLCTEDKYHNTRNVMTKLLAGYETRDREESFMLQEAKDNLESMPAFGLLEYYDESISWLADTFSWQHRDLEMVNVSTVSEQRFEEESDLNDANMQKVREVNWMDEELYMYARKLFIQLRK